MFGIERVWNAISFVGVARALGIVSISVRVRLLGQGGGYFGVDSLFLRVWGLGKEIYGAL